MDRIWEKQSAFSSHFGAKRQGGGWGRGCWVNDGGDRGNLGFMLTVGRRLVELRDRSEVQNRSGRRQAGCRFAGGCERMAVENMKDDRRTSVTERLCQTNVRDTFDYPFGEPEMKKER